MWRRQGVVSCGSRELVIRQGKHFGLDITGRRDSLLRNQSISSESRFVFFNVISCAVVLVHVGCGIV